MEEIERLCLGIEMRCVGLIALKGDQFLFYLVFSFSISNLTLSISSSICFNSSFAVCSSTYENNFELLSCY